MLSIHDRMQLVAPVPPDMESALSALFCAGGQDSIKVDVPSTLTWLRRLRADELWLACNCRGEIGMLPLLSPRQIDDTRVVLVRHGRVQHDERCPFHRLRSIADLVLDDVPGNTASSPNAVHRLLDRVRCGDAQGALFEVLRTAGYDNLAPIDFLSRGRGDRVTCSAVDVPLHYRRIDRSHDLACLEGHSFGELTCHHVSGFQWLGPRLQAGGLPGLFVGIIRDVLVDKKCLVSKKADQSLIETVVEGTLTVHSGPGPYWAIAGIDASSAQGPCKLVDAYVHPVYSAALLLPIDNAFERDVANVLLHQIRYWADVRQLAVDLHKPLATVADPLVPDFVLRLPNGKNVNIEAYPYDDSDYIQLRERLAKLSSSDDSPTVRIQAGMSNDESVRRRLTAVVLETAGL